jgi:flagellar basal body rod protein FlgB
MAKQLDSFEFPHGGRKPMEFDFDGLLDGNIYQLERGIDFDMDTTAETFLGALSRYANKRELRVNKHTSEDGNTVTVRIRPKTQKVEAAPKETAKATAKK